MEPLTFGTCKFVTKPAQTLYFYYKTSTVGTANQVLSAFYRINGGAWTAFNVNSNVGPSTYIVGAIINVQIGDYVQYFLNQGYCTPYGYGNGGPYTGGVLSGLTMVNGGDSVFFNICSTTISFCQPCNNNA
jgi:hypothetical protein